MPSLFGWLAVAMLVTTTACARATHEHNSAPSVSAVLPTGLSAATASDSAVDQELRRTLQALYTGFSFDAGAEPEWATLRALFLPGAAFVDPVKQGVAPRVIGMEEFLANFHRSIATDPALRAGFRERIVMARMDHFGHVAHAYVTFEGYVPRPGTSAPPATTRGVDSVQLVRGDGGTWLVASFTTQYEAPGALLPARFGGRSGA
jgi:hypothetical protein